jgi:hypothetical protein
MRYIPLRTVQIENAPDFEYAEAIRTVIRQPLDSQRGVSIDEMRRGIRILDKLDASTDILELEDADYDHLKAKVEVMQWGMVERNLLDFIDTVLNAKEAGSNGLIVRDAAKVM